MSPQEAFGIFFVLIGCAAPIIVIGVIYYLKKRLEHKQIMAAIEKGTPLSELKPPKQNGALWIRSLTIGIALLVFALPLLVLGRPGPGAILIAVLFGIGVAWIIRGLLHRKYQTQSQPSAKSNAAENKISAGGAATS
ncbi:MAG: hypothetical protein ACETVZ_05605 [Phycisphaerae bacterium]